MNRFDLKDILVIFFAATSVTMSVVVGFMGMAMISGNGNLREVRFVIEPEPEVYRDPRQKEIFRLKNHSGPPSNKSFCEDDDCFDGRPSVKEIIDKLEVYSCCEVYINKPASMPLDVPPSNRGSATKPARFPTSNPASGHVGRL